ncbi:MAG: DUF1289 domain-containing protein [Gammaproteobacteria bacterium]
MTLETGPNEEHSGAEPVASPCIDVCELDHRGLCLGCLRHSDEIMAWPSLDGHDKRQILARIEQRRELSTSSNQGG